MTVTPKALVPAKQLESSQTTQYTASNCTTIVDKATATNTTSSNVLLSVNIVTSGGSASASNLVIKTRSIAPNETYPCVELIGQVLEPGGFISTLAGTATAITFRVSGREIT